MGAVIGGMAGITEGNPKTAMKSALTGALALGAIFGVLAYARILLPH